MTQTTASPQNFYSEAQSHGFQVEVSNTEERWGRKPLPGSWIVTLSASFTPGHAAAYSSSEYAAQRLLAQVPMTYPGSVWGTDSASVGGHAGLTGGYVRLNKSGVSATFAKSLRKQLV